MKPYFIPEEWKANYRYAFEQAQKDRPRYLAWINAEIETAISLINSFDKVAILGGLAAKLINSTPTLYNHFIQNAQVEDDNELEEHKLQPDDDIEVLLEYAMNIATASANENKGILPTHEDIDALYDQLSKIKININFWEMSAEAPLGTQETDQWLRTMVVQDHINVRGQGYSEHVDEVYKEVFNPHNGFLAQYYGFDASDLLELILKLDSLIYSKIDTPYGFMHAMKRFENWSKVHGHDSSGGFSPLLFFSEEFAADNQDMVDPSNPHQPMSFSLRSIDSFCKIFWVIPENEKEKKIFLQLSIPFGGNEIFFASKFKGFPQGDTELKRRPLILDDEKHFHFSLNLGYRNIFNIAESLIREASVVYYDNYFRNNAHPTTKDNCIEQKTLTIFQKLLPGTAFYHSLSYDTFSDGQQKENELDILGASNDSVYLIEVKAGEYNTKIRRGALKGLKDKLKETVGKGSFQCHRAWRYIEDNANPTFTYAKDGARHTLHIDKTKIKTIYRITVTMEQLSVVGMEFRNLVQAGIIDKEYEGTWIISIYDLMVFRDLIATEDDFKEFLRNRMHLYQRDDVTFLDEVGVLGFYLDGGFPLPQVKADQHITMIGYEKDINDYYTHKGMALPVQKPVKKIK